MRSGASSVGDRQPFLAVGRERHLVALLLEGVLDAASYGVLVLDDQDRGMPSAGDGTSPAVTARSCYDPHRPRQVQAVAPMRDPAP